MIFRIRKQQETLEQLINNVKEVCRDGYKLLAKMEGMEYKVQCKQVHWQVHGKFYWPYVIEVYVNGGLVLEFTDKEGFKDAINSCKEDHQK